MVYRLIGADDVTGALPPKVRDNIAATFATKNELTNTVGKSAYQSWQDQGNTGTEADFVNSLKGSNGESAYQVAQKNGFVGTEAEWLDSLNGTNGQNGVDGDPGASAYQVARNNGYTGTEAEWLQSLQGFDGEDGLSAYQVAVVDGFTGTQAEWLATLEGPQGQTGQTGKDGPSAYQVWLANGNSGTETDFLNAIKGDQGEMGTGLEITGAVQTTTDLDTLTPAPAKNDAYVVNDTGLLHIYDGTAWSTGIPFKGDKGDAGQNGISAYQVARNNGFTGTEAEWLLSLEGADGDQGATGTSAYQHAVNNGFLGTEAEWVNSLAGTDGDPGENGEDGLSAYQVWLANGNTGSVADYLDSLKGDPGDTGEAGLSAYQIAQANGFTGTEAEWVASLEGTPGENGSDGFDGEDGTRGSLWFVSGQNGITTPASVPSPLTGDIYLDSVSATIQRYNGTSWVSAGSIKGASGTNGTNGSNGTRGSLWYIQDQDGITSTADVSAPLAGDIYLVPLTGDIQRYSGSSWVAAGSIQGPAGENGSDGLSAFQVARNNGFTGTETEWVASLEGDPAAFTIESKPATDAPSTYPDGITVMAVGADATWPAPWSAVETVKHSAPHRMWQTLVERNTARSWRRTPGTDTDTWNPWVEWGAKGDPGTTVHSELSGLTTSDDHTQYALADGTRGAFADPDHNHVSADITDATALATPNMAVVRDGFGGFATKYVWGLDAPAAAGDATNKGYVDEALGNKLGDITASSTTLNATDPATVEVTGTGVTRNLAFGIPTGPKGDAGTRGATWYVSGQNGVTTATSSVTGMIAGDIHLNASSGAISRYSGTAWASAGSIKGVNGTRGATWYIAGQGTVTTATSSVTGMITGDIHLNPTTGAISRYSGSTWVAAGNIQGPKGDTGTNGTSATITGVSADTLPSGSPATVELGGSETARTFAFGIPAGPKGDRGEAGTPAPIANTIFTVRYTGTAWEFATLAEAQAAGLNTEQTIWFIGNPGGSMPAWAREGDIWTQG